MCMDILQKSTGFVPFLEKEEEPICVVYGMWRWVITPSTTVMPPKEVIDETELEDRVLAYLKAENRPYNAADITTNLHNLATKPKITKVLAVLEAKGLVITKTYNKQAIHCISQSTIDCSGNYQELGRLEKEEQQLNEEIKSLQTELAEVRKTKSDEQVAREIQSIQNEIADYETLITENPTDSDALPTPEQLKTAQKELFRIRRELKTQTAIANNLFHCIQDNLLDQLGVEDKSELNDHLGLEWPV
jgi:cell division protein FtsB